MPFKIFSMRKSIFIASTSLTCAMEGFKKGGSHCESISSRGSNEHYHANFLAQLIYMLDISLSKSDIVVVCLRRRNVR